MHVHAVSTGVNLCNILVLIYVCFYFKCLIYFFAFILAPPLPLSMYRHKLEKASYALCWYEMKECKEIYGGSIDKCMNKMNECRPASSNHLGLHSE